jgi:hypothetical protein
MGSGWDPGPGSPTVVSWAGKPAKTFAPAKDFDGVLVAGEWPQRDNGLNGRFASGCSGIINASQGGVTRTQRVSTPAVGAVLFADRNRVFRSGDVICGGELFTLEHTGGLVVMVDTKVPLKLYYAHDGSIGIPDGIVAKGLCLPLEPASRGRVHFTLSKDRQSWEGTHVAKC